MLESGRAGNRISGGYAILYKSVRISRESVLASYRYSITESSKSPFIIT